MIHPPQRLFENVVDLAQQFSMVNLNAGVVKVFKTFKQNSVFDLGRVMFWVWGMAKK
jgi:hypothetical protein